MAIPKITIVTPSFNQGGYLEQTIDSVLSQNYPNLEYIIVDGGSTDNSVEIIKRYQSHLSYWVSEKDKGQSDALNKGIAKATGEIFNWLNSDDYLEPYALQNIGDYFGRTPETNVYAGYSRLFGENFPSIIKRLGIKDTAEDSILNFQMNQPSTFYRLQLIRDFGGVKSSLHYSMDLELWFRYLSQYGHAGIHFSDSLISNFRIHQTSKTETSAPGFLKDEHQLLFHISSGIDLPKAVLDFLDPGERYYNPVNAWKFDGIKRGLFYSLICEKYLGKAILQKKKSAGRKMLLNLVLNGRIKYDRRHLGLLYNLLLN